jgi:hypothetical protein
MSGMFRKKQRVYMQSESGGGALTPPKISSILQGWKRTARSS